MTRTLLAPLLLTISLGLFACSSDAAKTCTASEDQACTNTYTECINAAAAAADKVACQKCVDNYCGCYAACGNSCDKAKLSTACN